jgi:heparan-alpha-glucosaminide N-acetyltransferase
VANSKPVRVLAIDAFRGITILVMIFVNTLAGVRGMPAWMEHAPADMDGMTFPDVVFPAFLFIVGMSIPFAMAQRRAAGDNGWQLTRHVLVRAAGLLVFGVFMVNAEEGYNEAAMGMSIHLWSLLFYVCAILVCAVYRFENKSVAFALRAGGVAGLIALALAFRGGPDGSLRLSPQWWGILGLIGWAYLYAVVAWALARGRLLPLMALMLAGVGWYCLGGPGAAQTENAVHASIAICGTLTALVFFGGGHQAPQTRPFVAALTLAIALAMLAWLLRPYFKISKIYATPSWALYSSAICVLLFAAMYWLVDLKQRRGWTTFFRPAAANPLLVYIIPFIVYALMQLLHLSFPAALGAGWPGFAWAIAYAVIVMALAAGLNRMHIKLQL